MGRIIYNFFFRLCGWKVNGVIPPDKKFIIIVAPHTSNWDFMVGLAARSILKFDAKFLGKKELFRFPFGILFSALGGYPVDRKKHANMVDAVGHLFNEKENFIIAIAPEGTRKYVAEWKTGFYYISLKAKVPIVKVAFDYSLKQVIIDKPFSPSGDLNEDMKHIISFFKNIKGKYEKKLPEMFTKFNT